jgi:hypothetical protein
MSYIGEILLFTILVCLVLVFTSVVESIEKRIERLEKK